MELAKSVGIHNCVVRRSRWGLCLKSCIAAWITGGGRNPGIEFNAGEVRTMHLNVTLDDVKADTKLDRLITKRQSTWLAILVEVTSVAIPTKL